MNSQIYSIQDGYLTIEDKELQIHYKDSEKLPLSISQFSQGSSNLDLHIEKKGEKVLKETLYQRNQKHGEERCYREDGTLLSSCFFANGLLHGPCSFFFPNGKPASSSCFVQGKRQGKSLFWNEEGTLLSMRRFVDNLLEGKQEYYYPNGQLKTEYFCIQGFMDGEVKLYYPDGSLQRTIAIKHGKREGQDTFWEDSGDILFSLEYKDGSLFKTHVKDPYDKG